MCPVFLVLVHCGVVIINYTRAVHIYKRLYVMDIIIQRLSVAVQSSAVEEDVCTYELHCSKY
jgi:hypothetical protein